MMLCFHSVHGKRKCFYFQEIIKYLYKNRQISEISLLSSNLSKADVLRLLNVVFIDYDIDQIYPYSPSFQPVFLRYRQETVLFSVSRDYTGPLEQTSHILKINPSFLKSLLSLSNDEFKELIAPFIRGNFSDNDLYIHRLR